MDGVPIAFWTHLCDMSLPCDVTEAKELLGPFGELAETAFHYMLQYVTVVEEGIEKRPYLYFWCTERRVRASEEIGSVPKKFVRGVTINFKDARPENVSRELIQRFPHAFPNFVFLCPSISEAWVDFACSLKRSIDVRITKKLEDESVGLLQRLVDARKLSTIMVHEEDCEVLSNEVWGFFRRPWEGGVVRELLHFWSQNSDKLKGKRLVLSEECERGVKQLEEFLLRNSSSSFGLLLRMTMFIAPYFVVHRVLKVCSKEKCDAINKEYRHNYRRFHKPSCVYKFEEGEGSERRRLYISFECATLIEQITGRPKLSASHTGLDKLWRMRATTLLQVLFA
uniref:TIR domain-containing protein n=1 Tax=Steinernema glaseri TaxID=37863 RepID=A0A1I7ZSW6_9BILA